MKLGPRTLQALEIVSKAEAGTTRVAVAKAMKATDESAAKYLKNLQAAKKVLMLGRCGDRTIRYCTPENRVATLEYIERLRYGFSTGRHMEDDEFEEWTERVTQRWVSASGAERPKTTAPASVFKWAAA